jgi:hypothetical protein
MNMRFEVLTVVAGSIVDIANGCGLDDRGVGILVLAGVRIFTSRHSDQLWGP